MTTGDCVDCDPPAVAAEGKAPMAHTSRNATIATSNVRTVHVSILRTSSGLQRPFPAPYRLEGTPASVQALDLH